MRDGITHQVRRIRDDQGVDFGLRVENRAEQPRGAAQLAAGLVAHALDQHHVLRLDVAAVDVARRDEDALLVDTDRESPFGAREQHLLVGAADQERHLVAQLHFVARADFRVERPEIDVAVELAELDFGVGKVMRRAELARPQDQPGAEIERLEALERLLQRGSRRAGAVVFEQDRRVSGREGRRDVLAERFAARNLIRRVTDGAADHFGGGMHAGVRNLAGHAERDQRGRMGVQDSLDVRPHLVDGAVERKFARRLVAAFDGAVRLDADDVLAAQRALVDAGRADPHIAVGIEDRKVPAAGGRHAVAVNTLHDVHDLIARMDEICFVHV